jgi:hypothetical protein
MEINEFTTGLIPDVAQIVVSYIPTLYLYELTTNYPQSHYASIVVVASDEKSASRISPAGDVFF